jgi:hypothetical protein
VKVNEKADVKMTGANGDPLGLGYAARCVLPSQKMPQDQAKAALCDEPIRGCGDASFWRIFGRPLSTSEDQLTTVTRG